MKIYFLFFLAGFTVRCDDNYYVVQRPTETKEFKIYWNVPTMQCKSKHVPFEDLFDKYGIIQNTEDSHRGDKISILYDPGNFPALIRNESTGEIRYRNGGVPQQGDLIDHLQTFKHEMEKSIVDKDFSGLGIIDFESWRPILRQNFGILTPYKDVSYDIEKKRHWWWKKQWLQEEAQRRFDAAARDFMQTTLALAKKLRPKALWGYYGYPQCFNRPFNTNPEKCAKEIPNENDQIDWLWMESTALYPSVYSTKDMSSAQLAAFIRGRIKESLRVNGPAVPVLPYWWFRYRDGGYFSETDLEASFSTFYKSNATGFIIWGSSKDVNTKDKCLKLKAYLNNTLGPAIARYAKNPMRLGDDIVEFNETTGQPETVTQLDPEYNWVPPENYSQNIEQIVDEELKKETEVNGDHNKKVIENILVDLILHKIASYCSRNCGNVSSAEQTGSSEVPIAEQTGSSEVPIVEQTGSSEVPLAEQTGSSEVPIVLTTKDPFKETTIKPFSAVSVPVTTDDDSLVYYDVETTTSTTTSEADNDAKTTTTAKTETETSTNTIVTTTATPKKVFIKKQNTNNTTTSKAESTTDVITTTTGSENKRNSLKIHSNVWRIGYDETISNSSLEEDNSNTTSKSKLLLNENSNERVEDDTSADVETTTQSNISLSESATTLLDSSNIIVDAASNTTYEMIFDEVTENITSGEVEISKVYVTETTASPVYFGKISQFLFDSHEGGKENSDESTTNHKYDVASSEVEDTTTTADSKTTKVDENLGKSKTDDQKDSHSEEDTNTRTIEKPSTLKWNIRFHDDGSNETKESDGFTRQVVISVF